MTIHVMLSYGARTEPFLTMHKCACTGCAGNTAKPEGCQHKLRSDCLMSCFLTVRLYTKSVHLKSANRLLAESAGFVKRKNTYDTSAAHLLSPYLVLGVRHNPLFLVCH